MTEAEWLRCHDSIALLRQLQCGRRRKPALLIAACFRGHWPELPAATTDYIEMVEACADGQEDRARIDHDWLEFRSRWFGFFHEETVGVNQGIWLALHELVMAAWHREYEFHELPSIPEAEGSRNWWPSGWPYDYSSPRKEYPPIVQRGRRLERTRQADLVRDVFGNPFRPVAIEPGWLTWNHGTVPAIARRVYDEHRFEDLPILADALEDAGCTDAELLSHCRGPGPHVRGCWAVDLLLGKT